ncbi:MAG: hypothetical protein E6J20_16300 [Chloroflexi bacterium]|nr:MAG: hypothetical protein E6J20_16300 [Chloroflexota bacterium]
MGTQPPVDVEPPDEPPDEPPLDPPEPPPIGSGGSGFEGGGGSAGGWTTGSFGPDGHGTVCWSVTVTPWSLTLTGWPLAVTWPPCTCASPPALASVPLAVTSTTILLTFTVPTVKLSTSECVITVRVPPESITVFVWPNAPLNGCVPPPAL